MLEANGEAVTVTVGTTMTTCVPPTGTTTTTMLGGKTGKRFVESAEFDPPPAPVEVPVPSVEATVKVIRAVTSWSVRQIGGRESRHVVHVLGGEQPGDHAIGDRRAEAGDQVIAAARGITVEPRSHLVERRRGDRVERGLRGPERALPGQRQALIGDGDQAGPEGAEALVPPTVNHPDWLPLGTVL